MLSLECAGSSETVLPQFNDTQSYKTNIQIYLVVSSLSLSLLLDYLLLPSLLVSSSRFPIVCHSLLSVLCDMLAGHKDAIWDLATHPTEPRVLSASADGSIGLWNIGAAKPLVSIYDFMHVDK